jgi:hypothetical protein
LFAVRLDLVLGRVGWWRGVPRYASPHRARSIPAAVAPERSKVCFFLGKGQVRMLVAEACSASPGR